MGKGMAPLAMDVLTTGICNVSAKAINESDALALFTIPSQDDLRVEQTASELFTWVCGPVRRAVTRSPKDHVAVL